jgi:hypothetical protein
VFPAGMFAVTCQSPGLVAERACCQPEIGFHTSCPTVGLAVEPWTPGKEYGPQVPFAALVVQVAAGVEVGGDVGGALDEGGVEAGVDGTEVVGLRVGGFVVGVVVLGVVGVEAGVVGSLLGMVGADVAGEVAVDVAGEVAVDVAEVCGAGVCGVDEPPGEESRLCG